MTDIEITLPKAPEADTVIAAVEHAGAHEALNVTLKTSLKKYPECIHWHFKMGKEPGILEVTWWPKGAQERPARLWLSVHNNRKADWIVASLPQMKTRIEAQLSGAP